MPESQMEKISRIIKRTGDRVIVMDKFTDDTLVVMSLEEYENVMDAFRPVEGLNEKEMLDKINRDISLWRSNNDELSSEDIFSPQEIANETGSFPPALTNNFSRRDDREFDEFDDEWYGEISPEEIDPVLEDVPMKKNEEMNFSDKKADEVSLHDVPEEEEEKFYLEPVE